MTPSMAWVVDKLQTHIGKISMRAAAGPFIVRHGAWVYDAGFALGDDARTGFERVKGEPYRADL